MDRDCPNVASMIHFRFIAIVLGLCTLTKRIIRNFNFSLMQLSKSNNHMAVASKHLGVWSWSRQSPELQTECQNRKER